MMLNLRRKCLTNTRAFLSPLLLSNSSFSSAIPYPSFISHAPTSIPPQVVNWESGLLVTGFKNWFKSRKNPLMERIFEILKSSDEKDVFSCRNADWALSLLGLPLSETFVLQVLKYGNHVLPSHKRDHVLPCLKFFDWAGRQPGFSHTRATFNAIFKILAHAKLMSVMLDFLDTYVKQRYVHKVRFYNTLVMGYAVAGKLDIALQMFGKMRFQGQDLDPFTYHVLLNALVEEACFDAVSIVLMQLKMRGYENEFTQSIVMKSLCKQNQLDEAEVFLRGLVSGGQMVNGKVLGVLVDAFCKNKEFEHAGKLVDEFSQSGVVPMEQAYGVWIRDLVQARKLDCALNFFQTKKCIEGYVPEVLRYNILLCALLRQSRLQEVYDLLMEMKEVQVVPDKVTMNAALCFFCKAGMVEVALELYKARSEFGLTPNSMAYNYLINTLCGDGSVDEAYHILNNSLDQGYLLRSKTFSILADALCRERKFDKLMQLFHSLDHRKQSDPTYDYETLLTNINHDKYISALCRAKRVEDAYWIHGRVNALNKVSSMNSYSHLIYGFHKSKRADIAAGLLLEMQDKGHTPTRRLFRAVICSLCEVYNPEVQFGQLLKMQLSRPDPNIQICNFIIGGAGHAKRPDLAREFYEMMGRNGMTPNLRSDILMLHSYLKSGKISEALNFFNSVRGKRKKIGRKLYDAMVVGLSKAKRSGIALEIFRENRKQGMIPSLECYEELLKVLCSEKKYDMAIKLISDMEKDGRHVSSFIGNTLLYHSSQSRDVYDALNYSRDTCNQLHWVIAVFSGHKRADTKVEDLVEMIQQCFPLDTFSYNMLFRRLVMDHIDDAWELFNRMRQKGYEPNKWTYDILLPGLIEHGRTVEAKILEEEMSHQIYSPQHSNLWTR